MSSRYKSEPMNNKRQMKYFDVDKYVSREVDKLLSKSMPKTIDTLVLSGGSVKGIAEIGALHYMESQGVLKNIKTIAGTSAGSFIGTMISIGYRPVEIYHFFMNIDISKTTKINAYNLFNRLGLDDGKRYVLVIKKFLKAKSISTKITFMELYKKTKIKLIITGACVNDKKAYYFSHESVPNMRIVDALRISMSIPIMLTPRKYKGKVFVDGGCIDNYPIALFNHKIESVIGVHVAEKKEVVEKITSIETYLKNTISCLQEGVALNANRGYESSTIFIICKSGDDKESFMDMFDQGYKEAIEFFKNKS